ncbi:hypothetical protein ACMFMG_008745 [Clarireedia jacksonii]
MEAIEKLAAETQKSAAVADEAGRKEILNSLRDLQYSIEKPEDTMPRVIHLPSGLAHQTALTSSPSRKSVQTGPAEKAVFVDIRVASGQQCIEFQKRFPDIRGRTIFQDFAGEIEHATSQGLPDGIEAMVHDFYTPQIIKGFTTIQPQEITILYDTDTTIAELEEFNNNKADILIERQIFDSIEVYD